MDFIDGKFGYFIWADIVFVCCSGFDSLLDEDEEGSCPMDIKISGSTFTEGVSIEVPFPFSSAVVKDV